MAKKKKEQPELPLITLEEYNRGIGDIAEEAYLKYGAYVNHYRHTCSIMDGCKVSYRRLIYTATTYPKGKDIPTSELIPSISRIHPHSTSGVEGTNAMLVKSGVFSGEGNFGSIAPDGTELPHSATRYTKNRLSDLYWEIIGDLLKEVPYSESPVGPLEPDYLPLPLPLCLYLKAAISGLGVAMKSDYPNFSPWSLYQALVNDNPMLLEPGMNLILDKANSELEKLWKTGKGRVVYSYKISRATSEDGRSQGILFEGDTELFTPGIFRNKTYKKWIEEGKVYYENLTDINGPKAFIGKVPGSKGVTPEDIEDLCRKNCFSGTIYNLNVTNGSTAWRIPLRDWLRFTYDNYIKLISEVNLKRIAKCEFDIKVQQALPIIASYILNNNPKASDLKIQSDLGIELEVVEAVMSKPISWLRKNSDTSERVKSLKNKLRELKKFDPIQFTEEIIKRL